MAEAADKLKIAQRRKARNFLLQALYQWQLAAGTAAEIEAQYRADNNGKIDWAYFHDALVYIHREAANLDELYQSSLDRSLNDLDPIEIALLRLGTYELKERIDVPYRVVINEYVELAKKYGATDSHKYINGVLDKLARSLRSVEIGARA